DGHALNASQVEESKNHPQINSQFLPVVLGHEDMEVRECRVTVTTANLRAWKKPLLSKKNIREKLQPASEHAGKEQSSGNNVL
uniref:Uncharacterized protein n=1 Tax=Haplochromis burtoni TaxID=8153 RepID=A0A3Q2WFE0_HAPBU